MDSDVELQWREKVAALQRAVRFRPFFTIGLMFLGGVAAILEGIGLGFIYPIIRVAQSDGPVQGGGPVLETFLAVYDLIGLPFSLGYLIVGVAVVMTIRYSLSFIVGWLRAILSLRYDIYLRDRALTDALDAEIRYFDRAGSDNILNAIITEARYSGRALNRAVQSMEYVFLVVIYMGVMLYITPVMTAMAVVLLGGITVLIRFVIEPAVSIGARVAEANERVQEAVQAAIQGIREVKLFGLTDEFLGRFRGSIQGYADSEIRLRRNESAITNFYQLAAAITIFILIYVGFEFSGLSLGELGIFLIAMFQLAPRVSKLNNMVYSLEGLISHLVRTHQFIDDVEGHKETGGDRPIDSVTTVEFDEVKFSYDDGEDVLQGLSFIAQRGSFIGFVGQSGAGKSTIVSLLTRIYEPDDGEIRGDGVSIDQYDLREWRDRIAVVRQQPFIFDDTLWANITIGDRGADREAVDEVCEIAKIDEFFDDLPNGYDSELGEDGVRLSGGQRQRIALARALLKDADFLVLDEATSDLDSDLERTVHRAIESMDRDYGIIAIAHRLSTVTNADRIHVIQNGQIIESGSHQELLDTGERYAELYEIQSN